MYLRFLPVLLTTGLLLAGCSSTKTVTTDTPSEVRTPQTLNGVAGAFVQAVTASDLSPLAPFLPDAGVARQLSPEKTADMTDEQIRDQMLSDLEDRLEGNIQKMHRMMVQNGFDPKNLEVVEVTEEPSTDPPLVPRVLTILMQAGDKQSSVPVTYLHLDDRYIVFEVLFISNFFQPD